MRIRFIFIFAITCSLLAFASEGRGKSNLSLSHKKADLRHTFIPEGGWHSKCGPNHPVDIRLSRTKSSKAVAIVRLAGGTFTLNPPGENYGLIPELGQITSSQAAQLWGSDGKLEAAPNGLRSYQLTCDRGDTYSIDLYFENNKLLKYRVRSNYPLQTRRKWFFVKRKTQ